VRIAIVGVVMVAMLGTARADGDARARWSVDDEPHAGMPFELDLQVEGFDETPAPAQPKLDLPGATVRPLGAQPSVSRSIQIVNGRRSDSTSVTWVFRWSVEAAKDGVLHVPATTATQGGKRATAPGGDITVDAVPATDAMKLELALPDRAVFVGENIPVTLTWLFRAEPQKNPVFQVPMLDGDAFTIGTPPATNQRTYKFQGGDKELDLPFKVDQTEVSGVTYNRLVATFYAAPRKTGKIEVAPASVVAPLPVGRADFFGNAPSRMFRASDVARTLEVKPLPETDRPPGFAGAVGTQFSIKVATSRSVVSLGEPVELDITVKSDERLDTLALGKLDGEGGLPKDTFSVPADPPTGELSDDGKTKTFKVTAQVTGPASEIPAIAFAYFDPVKGAYQVVHSDPIALSVKGSSVVGASDVVSATPNKPAPAAPTGQADLALVGADLALSAPGDTDDTPASGALLWLAIALLYALPLAILAARTWSVRTRSQREEAAEVRDARRAVERELVRAAKDPARDTAGPLAAALRGLARALERQVGEDGLLAQIETESFAPAAAAEPLSSELRGRAHDAMRRWIAEGRRAPRRGKSAAAALALAIALVPAHARAAGDPQQQLADGRADYQSALALGDAAGKRAAFERAEVALGEAAHGLPDRPELLADWGNAALGAGDVATATLAYRRALAIDPGNARARRNLAWLRSRQPDAVRPGGESATDTLLFFHRWPRTRRLVVGAIAFALAVLLLVPWRGRRRTGLAMLAILPAAIWLAMGASLVLEDRHAADAVVMDAVVLRAADSAGAPAAMSQPLPRGAEVTIDEQREGWTKLRLASGATGWVQAGAVERVATK